jgi:hypothetical protein
MPTYLVSSQKRFKEIKNSRVPSNFAVSLTKYTVSHTERLFKQLNIFMMYAKSALKNFAT